MKTKILNISLILLLLISVYFNIKPDKNNWFYSFQDANTRPTYDTFHHIREAQALATGDGIKVGIIGKYFGFSEHRNFYAGGKNFTDNKESFEDISEHGFWMATTLKEISPNIEIYALCARDNDRAKEAMNIANAIDWAIDNDIDILTYSAQAFRDEDRDIIDKAVLKAIDHNIVTTFIHYDLKENILPNGFFRSSPKTYDRQADINIFHFDYNLLLRSTYNNFLESDRDVGNNIGAYPYFSNSSMSVVLAGIVAMMKEKNNNLTPDIYKDILIATSMEIEYKGYQVKHVVNAVKAINTLSLND